MFKKRGPPISYQPKYSQQISQDEGPFRAGQSAMDRFLLVVQCVIGGGKVKANLFHETMKCLFALVVARGWMNLSNRLKLF